jgi:purine-binding chemotaxis protein CheW
VTHGNTTFAVAVADLFRVLSAGECALRSGLPPPLIGWAEAGGARIPVTALDGWLRGFVTSDATPAHVVAIDTGAGLLGLAVDHVRGIATVLETEIREPTRAHPPVVSGLWPQRTDTVAILDARQFAAEARRRGGEVLQSLQRAITPAAAAAGRARTRAFCLFERRGRHFAVPVLATREVIAGEELTPVPQAPDHVLGVVNLRGHLLPLINADSFLGLPVSEAPTAYEALVVESDGVQLGLLVDRVGDVRPVDLLEVQPAPPMERTAPIYCGVWSTPTADVLLLDIDHLVARAVASATRSFQRTVSALSGLEEDTDAVADASS